MQYNSNPCDLLMWSSDSPKFILKTAKNRCDPGLKSPVFIKTDTCFDLYWWATCQRVCENFQEFTWLETTRDPSGNMPEVNNPSIPLHL